MLAPANDSHVLPLNIIRKIRYSWMWPLPLEFSHPHLLVSLAATALTELETIPVDPGVIVGILHCRKSCHWLEGDISLGDGLLVNSFHFDVSLFHKTTVQLHVFVALHYVFLDHVFEVFFWAFDAFVVMWSEVVLGVNVQLSSVGKFFLDSINSSTWTAREDIPFGFMGVVFVSIVLVENICSFQF